MSLIDCGLPEDMKVNSSVKIPAAGFPVKYRDPRWCGAAKGWLRTRSRPLGVLQAFEQGASASPNAFAVVLKAGK